MIKNNGELLFSTSELSDIFSRQKQSLYSEIDFTDNNYLLNVSVQEFFDYLQKKFAIAPLSVNRENKYIKRSYDTNIDVRYDPNRCIFDTSRPAYVNGASIEVAVPFDGQKELFFCIPTTRTYNPPRASVENGGFVVSLSYVDETPERIKQEIDKVLSEIDRYVGWVNADVAKYNSELPGEITRKIESRKLKIMKDQGVVAFLGIPFKENLVLPKTYSIPTIQKKMLIQRPDAVTSPYTPEPALDMKNYEAILRIISDMTIVMERSPKAFIDMEEEDLRTQILVPLNGHFIGGATPETFNYEGKTDILIRANGKNVFIAECLIWRGEKYLLGKVDQLLGYSSWRDTKAAIIIFNRNKDFSNILSQIPGIIQKHGAYKRTVEYKSESGFRFIIHNRDDKNKEIILTILAFDLPKEQTDKAVEAIQAENE